MSQLHARIPEMTGAECLWYAAVSEVDVKARIQSIV